MCLAAFATRNPIQVAPRRNIPSGLQICVRHDDLNILHRQRIPSSGLYPQYDKVQEKGGEGEEQVVIFEEVGSGP